MFATCSPNSGSVSSMAEVRAPTRSSAPTCPWARRRPYASRVLQSHRGVHRRRGTRSVRGRRRQRRISQRLPGGRQVRSERAHGDHAACRLPARQDGRLEPHRRLQHSRQPVHDDATAGDARGAPAVRPAPGGLHRRFRARRCHDRTLFRRPGAHVDHARTPTATSSWSATLAP